MVRFVLASLQRTTRPCGSARPRAFFFGRVHSSWTPRFCCEDGIFPRAAGFAFLFLCGCEAMASGGRLFLPWLRSERALQLPALDFGAAGIKPAVNFYRRREIKLRINEPSAKRPAGDAEFLRQYRRWHKFISRANCGTVRAVFSASISVSCVRTQQSGTKILANQKD
jgi:hypothetical protein